MSVRILVGDALTRLRELPDGSARCCVTSPPYWGLRDYGVTGQMGLEPTPAAFVEAMTTVFREVRRVLTDDGTLWLNLGDSYATGGGSVGRAPGGGDQGERFIRAGMINTQPNRMKLPGLKSKDLIGIPWRIALALQADGWYLRSDIIWAKPNPMPESVTDRPTKSHEYIFLLSKSERYFYDAKAIAEDAVWLRENKPDWQKQRAKTNEKKGCGNRNAKSGGFTKWGTEPPVGKGGGSAFRGQGHFRDGENGPANREGREIREVGVGRTRNARTVWTMITRPFRGAHFATFPTELPERCIAAGSAVGDTILDPFGGAGTTGLVAVRMGRNAVLIELNPAYAAMATERISGDLSLFANVELVPAPEVIRADP